MVDTESNENRPSTTRRAPTLCRRPRSRPFPNADASSHLVVLVVPASSHPRSSFSLFRRRARRRRRSTIDDRRRSTRIHRLRPPTNKSKDRPFLVFMTTSLSFHARADSPSPHEGDGFRGQKRMRFRLTRRRQRQRERASVRPCVRSSR